MENVDPFHSLALDCSSHPDADALGFGRASYVFTGQNPSGFCSRGMDEEGLAHFAYPRPTVCAAVLGAVSIV